jgi:hypothetical protein
MRELSYFPAADTTFPWLVLTAWAVGGILLSMIGHFRTAGGAESDSEAAAIDDDESLDAERPADSEHRIIA